jgi:alpha-L-arabinofuranosidase
MAGMERNSDMVVMASYAPLFVNLNHRAWNPDLINYDSSRWYGLPSYYVQQMFSVNRGDQTLPINVNSPDVVVPSSKGMIGVGAWNTEVEFKDIKVTSPDGQILFTSDFSRNSDGWNKLGEGARWSVADGVLRQNEEREFTRAIAGDHSWTDYTLTLKARKLDGKEGFLILFHIANDEDRIWWNLGGWNNTQDAVESAGHTIDSKPGHIESNRWYDIRLVVSGKRVKCFCDGQMIHDVEYESEGQVKALYASATSDQKTGNVIVKVVNTSTGPLETKIDLSGAKNLTGKGSAIVLTSASPTDENTLDHPIKVFPVTEPFQFGGEAYDRVIPGNSINILLFGTR